MNRLKIARYIALGATLCSLVGIYGVFVSENTFLGGFLGFGALAGIVSYFFGGFGKAIKMAGKIAMFGWYILPFPVDLISIIFTFILAIYVFFFFPIIPVSKAYNESNNY